MCRGRGGERRGEERGGKGEGRGRKGGNGRGGIAWRGERMRTNGDGEGLGLREMGMWGVRE